MFSKAQSTINRKNQEDAIKVFEQSICIPVITDNATKFTIRDKNDPFHPIDIAEKIANLITTYFHKYGSIKLPNSFDDWVGELVENSYDAFAKQGLVVGKSLMFKIVIKQVESDYIVSIKDNAGGFSDKLSGQCFSLDEIKPEKKEESYFIGGAGIGLINLHTFSHL
ncbi:MAG: hypothetical protein HYX60_04575 [Legionella longbeachae]|nr:hypothetical protein [Legionella longbeachae]